MRASTALTLAVVLLTLANCGDNAVTPTIPLAPSPSPPTLQGAPCSSLTGCSVEPFHVTGSVTDGEGLAVAAATVSLQLISGPRLATVSDAVGSYEFSFQTYRNMPGYVGGVTGARVGHESDTRGLGIPSAPDVVINLRLHRIRRIAAGESVALTVLPDDPGWGDEWEWVARRVRIAIPASGTLAVSLSSEDGVGRTGLDVFIASEYSSARCCSPDVLLPVVAGQEVVALVLTETGTGAHAFTLKTSLLANSGS